eukprot:TRINITY_DN19067_c0_g1_i1.p1 TRINITY_DN19067_c0_g1~~TRINITY_DN19067_c0_g1_i1.p1  ORF type:complete len:722 (+),score=162.14 TRINITY_DN19067_c0_g1_i1:52-2166(+)
MKPAFAVALRTAIVLPLLGCFSVRAASSSSAANRLSVGVTPVQKVLDLLSKLAIQGETDMQDEKVRFASLSQWCASVEGEKKRSIQSATSSEEQLGADILKAETDIETLEQGISDLDANIDGWSSENNNNAKTRQAENEEFSAMHLDLVESIDAIERALVVLKSRSKNVPQSLLEVGAVLNASVARQHPKLASEVARAVDVTRGAASLLSSSASGNAAEAPHAYEFQSTSVVDLLKRLRERFLTERESLEKEEMNRKHAFEVLSQRLNDDIRFGKDSRSEKMQTKARIMQEHAEAKDDLDTTQRGKEADEKYLREMLAECQLKSADFERRQALRVSELKALREAMAIVSSPTVAGAASKHLPSFLVETSRSRQGGSMLAQMRGSDAQDYPSQHRAAAALLSRAARVGSQLLASVASRLEEDPFAKVKQMITDLLARLEQEAAAEADHKGWCDEEMGTNKKTRDEKTAEVAALSAQIEQLTALEQKLAQEISDLLDGVAEIDAAMSEATLARMEEKAKNAAIVKEATDAKVAVTQAMTLLREFYEQAATATSFAQRQSPQKDMPFVFDGAYKGMQSGKGGVIGMLEVIESDFARLAADTRTSEGEAVSTFQAMSDASAEDRKAKETGARHRGFEKTRATRDLNQAKTDIEATQSELDAALSYYDKLKPTCVGAVADYGERVNMRQEEIESLKEALRILNGEDLSA